MCLIKGRKGNMTLLKILSGGKQFTEVGFVSSRHPGVTVPGFWGAQGEMFPVTTLWRCTCGFDHPQRQQMTALK